MRSGVPFYIAGLVLALDQLVKGLVVAALRPGESMPLVPGLLYLSRAHNTGSAFGLLRGRNPFLAVAAAAIAAGVAWAVARGILRGRAERLGGGLILGGALGNLCDRVLRGYVVDYLDFRYFPAFNLADAAVMVGAVLVGIGILWRRR